MERPQFVVLVPVKDPDVGKSRLQVPPHLRPGLATAFALDTLHAARDADGVAEVVVVTADAGFAAIVSDLGFARLDDAGDLNESLASAAAVAREHHPTARPVALCADLPCLRPEDLAQALQAVPDGTAAYVADAAGSGTTLYTAPYDGFTPAFGIASAAGHVRSGAVPLAGELRSLRHDVDDESSLIAAMRLGVGRFTQDVVTVLGAGA